jgi:hypothetical protein
MVPADSPSERRQAPPASCTDGRRRIQWYGFRVVQPIRLDCGRRRRVCLRRQLDVEGRVSLYRSRRRATPGHRRYPLTDRAVVGGKVPHRSPRRELQVLALQAGISEIRRTRPSNSASESAAREPATRRARSHSRRAGSAQCIRCREFGDGWRVSDTAKPNRPNQRVIFALQLSFVQGVVSFLFPG